MFFALFASSLKKTKKAPFVWAFFGGAESSYLGAASEWPGFLVWYIKPAFGRNGNHSSSSSAAVNKSHFFKSSNNSSPSIMAAKVCVSEVQIVSKVVPVN
jgi:hypothetical protein